MAITAEMAKAAQAALVETGRVAANSARGLRRRGEEVAPRGMATLAELKEVMATLEKVLAQLCQGNPADAPLLRPAFERIKERFGKTPRAITADRGYGEVRTEAELAALGMKKAAIPRRGKAPAVRREVESARGFRKLVKWRTGSEGRIAALKRNYGWSRTLMDGTAGAATWCAWGVFAHNGIKLADLVRDAAGASSPPKSAPRRRSGSAPPRQRSSGAAPPPTSLVA
jgi:IS5 family transposase